MNQPYNLSLKQARTVMLATLGLLTPPSRAASKEDVLQVIKAMSVLQIDTIHVVHRSPYLVLWNRLGTYDIKWLEELLSERKIFEYWSHAACLLPIEDYPNYKAIIDSETGWQYQWSAEWIKTHPEDTHHVLQYITKHGPVMSSTFKNPNKTKGGWWNWKTEKIALDALYVLGELTIVGRKNFQRIYDLHKRGIPPKYLRNKEQLPNVYAEFVERTVKTLGITKKSWIADYFRLPKNEVSRVFEKLLLNGTFITATVKGFDEDFYIHPDNQKLIDKVIAGTMLPTHTCFLSPFDPLVWDRKRVLELFNFNYQIESYTPMSKRKYGYFTLPILYQGELIGRMDAKAHRKERIFEVKSLHFEESFEPDTRCFESIAKTLHDFADWHNTPRVIIQTIFPPKDEKRLQSLLKLQSTIGLGTIRDTASSLFV